MSLLTAHASRGRAFRHLNQVWWLGYTCVVGGGLLLASIARSRITAPFLGVSLGAILLVLTGWVIRPQVTLYATLFLTAVSDIVTVWWFPFVKNFSSRESISFISDYATFSPLELSLCLGFAVSTLRRYANGQSILPRTALTWPLLTFMLFVLLGLVLGLGRGGDLRIAILESRGLFYIVLMFVVVVNVCASERELYRCLMALLGGVIVQAMLSLAYLGRLDAIERDSLESLNEHGSALGQNLLALTILCLVLFRVRNGPAKAVLLIGLIPTVFIYFVSQRRAGIAALAIGAAVVAIALYWRQRRVFWFAVPLAAVGTLVYVAAFWHSSSYLAFPAQAMKGLISPGSATQQDQSSDMYRTVEAFNLNYTIRSSPILGLGFGLPFYRPIPLANIDFFALNAYLPHNSILWIWIKTGFGGFAALFYLVAKSILIGADRIRRTPDRLELAVTLSGVVFVVMYTVYSYVDVSWDARNGVFLGLALAICAPAILNRQSREHR